MLVHLHMHIESNESSVANTTTHWKIVEAVEDCGELEK